MKNSFTLFIGIAIVLLLLAYMFAFQVRYDEVVVLTTFDEATEPELVDGRLPRDAQDRLINSGSIKAEPGFYLRWPWPIQKVYRYPTRVRVLEDRIEQLQTADGFSLIVQMALMWRIENPRAFYINLKDEQTAETQLLALMRDQRSAFGKYRFDQLVNTDPNELKLREIEKLAAKRIAEKLNDQGYGIKVEQVLIRRTLLPSAVTAKVFERMKATRQKMAADIRGSGVSEASAIRAEAEAARSRILGLARSRSQALIAQGQKEAAEVYDIFAQDEDLAKFLTLVDAMREFLKERSTLIIPSEQFGLDRLIEQDGKIVPAPPPTPTPLAPDANQTENNDSQLSPDKASGDDDTTQDDSKQGNATADESNS